MDNKEMTEKMIELTKQLFLDLPTPELEKVLKREKELVDLIEEELKRRKEVS